MNINVPDVQFGSKSLHQSRKNRRLPSVATKWKEFSRRSESLSRVPDGAKIDKFVAYAAIKCSAPARQRGTGYKIKQSAISRKD